MSTACSGHRIMDAKTPSAVGLRLIIPDHFWMNQPFVNGFQTLNSRKTLANMSLNSRYFYAQNIHQTTVRAGSILLIIFEFKFNNQKICFSYYFDDAMFITLAIALIA